VPVVIGIGLGIAADDAFAPPAWLWALSLLPAGFLWRARRAAPALLFAAAALTAAGVGGLRHLAAMRRVPADHIVHFTAPDPSIARIAGTIISEPTILDSDGGPFQNWSRRTARSVFICQVETVLGPQQAHTASGLIRVTVREPALRLRMGDRVELFGHLFRPPLPSNPGEFDWARWNARNGIRAGMSCPNALCARRLGGEPGSRLRMWWSGFRARARAMLLADLPGADAADATLLEAVILGQRSSVDRKLDDAFVRTGCAHYLAASGLNVGILASLIWWIMRLLQRARRESALYSILATGIYLLIADPRPPILRAGIMTVCLCLSHWLRRGSPALNGLVVSGIIILLIWPASLFDVGFQLSFAAVIGLFYLSPAIVAGVRRLLRRDPLALDGVPALQPRAGPWTRRFRAAGNAMLYGVAVSLAAWLATLPISLYHFHQVCPWGAGNSVITTIVVWIVTMLGYFKLLIAPISPTLGHLVGAPLEWMTAALAWLIIRLADVSGTNITCPPPPLLLIVAYGAALVAAANYLHGRWRLRWPLSSASVCALTAVVWLWPAQRDGALRVTALSVGHGSATVIELPDGHVLLYDCGGSDGMDVGQQAVVPYLLSRGRTRVAAAIISHPDLDHFSGLLGVLDHVGCGKLYSSPQFAQLSAPSSPSAALLAELRRRGRALEPLHQGSGALDFGKVHVEILWPPTRPPFDLSHNESSIVMRVRFGDRALLFTGDIEARAERWLMDHTDLHADVLIAPHHGSVTATTREFIQAVNPHWIIRSASQRTSATRNGFNDIVANRNVLNTADVGAVTITMTEPEVRVESFRY
jgi:competence protein ComEC